VHCETKQKLTNSKNLEGCPLRSKLRDADFTEEKNIKYSDEN